MTRDRRPNNTQHSLDKAARRHPSAIATELLTVVAETPSLILDAATSFLEAATARGETRPDIRELEAAIAIGAAAGTRRLSLISESPTATQALIDQPILE